MQRVAAKIKEINTLKQNYIDMIKEWPHPVPGYQIVLDLTNMPHISADAIRRSLNVNQEPVVGNAPPNRIVDTGYWTLTVRDNPEGED